MNADIFMQDLQALMQAEIDVRMIESGVVHASDQRLEDLRNIRSGHEVSLRYQIDMLMRTATAYKAPPRYR